EIRVTAKQVSCDARHWWLCGRAWGERCSELRRKQVEIKGRDIPIVVEIAAAETGMTLPVVARQDVEVQRVDRSIMIGVAGQDEEIKPRRIAGHRVAGGVADAGSAQRGAIVAIGRSEEHTSELKSLA